MRLAGGVGHEDEGQGSEGTQSKHSWAFMLKNATLNYWLLKVDWIKPTWLYSLCQVATALGGGATKHKLDDCMLVDSSLITDLSFQLPVLSGFVGAYVSTICVSPPYSRGAR